MLINNAPNDGYVCDSPVSLFFSFIITQSNYLENIRAVKVNPQNLQNKIKLKFSEKKNNAHTDRG